MVKKTTKGDKVTGHDFNTSDDFAEPQKIKTSSSFLGEQTNEHGKPGYHSDVKAGHKLMCNVCEDNIKGGDVLKIEPGTWIHSECFICAMCSSPLDPNAYYVSYVDFTSVVDTFQETQLKTSVDKKIKSDFTEAMINVSKKLNQRYIKLNFKMKQRFSSK